MNRPVDWKTWDKWCVVLVALHSFLVGALMLFFPHWTVDFAGWKNVDYDFFIRQSGAFHFVMALGYLLEFRRYGSIGLLVIAKTTAVVFLLAFSSWTDAWAIPFSGVTDGLMLAVVVAVHGLAKRTL